MTFEEFEYDELARPRIVFGLDNSLIKQNDQFIYIERSNSIEIIENKNTTGNLVIPSKINGKEVLRIRSNTLFS